MVVQQQKSVRSVGGNSPLRGAKIFKFRRFRCKNRSRFSPNALLQENTKLLGYLALLKAVFMIMEMPCSDLLPGCVDA